MVRLANKLSDIHGLRSLCMRSAVLALRGPMLAVYPQASIRHLAGRGPDRNTISACIFTTTFTPIVGIVGVIRVIAAIIR
jgi:hypothetical protein